MKLFYAAPSPFVRKCLVCAHELGLRERIELVPAAAHPVHRDPHPRLASWYAEFAQRKSLVSTAPA